MKIRSTFVAVSFLAASLPSFADTFTLKDGTTLEGTIISESPESYVLDIQITKSIKDSRTIAKTEVVKVQREQLDQKAFEAVASQVPAPDFLTVDEYVSRISTVEQFLKKFPASKDFKKAKDILDTLKSESAAIADGGVKMNGEIVPASDYKANAYDLDARIQEARIRRSIEAGNLLSALRGFSTFDRDFRSTLSHGALSPLIKQVIQSHVAEARQSLQSLEARLKNRQLGLQRMSSEDRPVTEAAIREEDAQLEAAFKAEKDSKISWVTTSPFHKGSLEETVRFGEAEIIRLNASQTALGVDGGKAYREAWTAVHSGKGATAVAAAIAAAKSALVPASYLAPLEEAAKGIK